MVSFVDGHRDVYVVEPICKVLPIAPSTYYEQKAREADPSKLPSRLQRDLELRGHIGRIWRDNFSVYGVRKVWRQLHREGIPAARCTVMRLMRQMGLQGAIRGRKFKTTVSSDRDFRPADLVTRNFRADRPNRLWVADLTYLKTWCGFVYVAFVIDVLSRRVVGWRVSNSLRVKRHPDSRDKATPTFPHLRLLQCLMVRGAVGGGPLDDTGSCI